MINNLNTGFCPSPLDSFITNAVYKLPENRYGVVEQSKDGFSYLFSTRFAFWSDAVEYAELEAEANPGKYDYYVVYFDTKSSATQPKPTVTSTSSF